MKIKATETTNLKKQGVTKNKKDPHLSITQFPKGTKNKLYNIFNNKDHNYITSLISCSGVVDALFLSETREAHIVITSQGLLILVVSFKLEYCPLAAGH